MIKVRIPATTANLGPGFDCLGLALKIYLHLEIEERKEKDLEIKCEGEEAGRFPLDEHNLIWKSMNLVSKKINRSGNEKGLKIKIFNEIPVTRGLGSSAAAIIGGIVGATKLFKAELTQQEMLELALSLEGHPDNIVPALVGGLNLSFKTEQEEIGWQKIKTPEDLKIILAVPDFYLSTREMRRVLPKNIALSDAIFNIGRVALLVNAIQNSDWGILGRAMEDRLHQPYRAPFIPGIEKIFSGIKSTGLAGVALSGSGPTIASLTKKGSEEIIGKIIKESFLREGISCKIIVTEADLEGTKIV